MAACRRPQLVAGKSGKALRIADVDGDLWMDSLGNLDPARGTLSFWFKPEFEPRNMTTYPLFWNRGDRHGAAEAGMILAVTRGRLLFQVGHPRVAASAALKTDRQDDGWRHVAASWNCREGVVLYLDGTRVAAGKGAWRPHRVVPMLLGARPEEKW